MTSGTRNRGFRLVVLDWLGWDCAGMTGSGRFWLFCVTVRWRLEMPGASGLAGTDEEDDDEEHDEEMVEDDDADGVTGVPGAPCHAWVGCSGAGVC